MRLVWVVMVVGFLVCSVGFGYDWATNPGAGTEDDPYQISTAEQLMSIGSDPNLLDRAFVLMNNIDLDPALPGRRVFDTAVIAPDLKPDSPHYSPTFEYFEFRGRFDGNGYEILNLTIVKYDDPYSRAVNYIGLFGSIGKKGIVKNLVLSGGSVMGDNKTGAIAGQNDGLIINCSSDLSVAGNEATGGLVGYCYGYILKSFCTGSVFGVITVGGISGGGGTISNCYSSGTVQGNSSEFLGKFLTNCVGGIAGGWAVINNCYSTSLVTANIDRAGGLIGYGRYVVNSYATCGGTGQSNVAGLMGHSFDFLPINSYFLAASDGGGSDNGYGSCLTDSEMRLQSSFAGWDFYGNNVDGMKQNWQMAAGGGYPELAVFTNPVPAALAGSGTKADPYQIGTAGELSGVWWYPVDSCFRLENEINLAGMTWHVPVVEIINGVFDGNGYAIRNVQGSGIFGSIWKNGIVKNLSVENAILANSGLADYNLGLIDHCSITGTVTGDSILSIGGLVNTNDGAILNSFSEADVTGEIFVGGLAGLNNGAIWNCYATGDVTEELYGDDDDSAGGLVGWNGGSVRNCFANGDVTGTDYVGGLVGKNRGTVSVCYASGLVDGVGELGGLVGGSSGNYEQGQVVRSYYLIQPYHHYDNYIGESSTDSEMRMQESFVRWDFAGESENGTNETWQMPAGGGYPELAMFHRSVPVPLSGGGTEGDPYAITSAAELGMIPWYPLGSCFELKSDIDLAEMYWSCPAVPYLDGHFYGNGHVIRNMRMYSGGYLGLVGIIGTGGRVENLGMEDVNFVGEQDGAAGICCVNHGIIHGSYSNGRVESRDILNFFYTGGLAGFSDGMIKNCYSTAEAILGNTSRGFVGYNEGQVIRCYGGETLGRFSSRGLVKGYFWDVDTSGVADVPSSYVDYSGMIGLTTSEMKQRDSFTDSGWDFVGEDGNGTGDEWRMCMDGVEYPRLWWEFGADVACEDGVDYGDFGVVAREWQSMEGDGGWYDNVDVNFDGVVDFGDVVIIGKHWLE